MRTRTFKSGNSLAVRIPKELAFLRPAQDVEIERKGDNLIVRPVRRRSMTGVMKAFAGFPPGFMAGGREFHEQADRAWDDAARQKRKGTRS